MTKLIRAILILSLAVLCCCLLPTGALAYDDDNFIADYSVSCSGDGWSYDASTVTLTFHGFHLVNDDENYQHLSFSNAPAGFTFYLADGSVNTVPSMGGEIATDPENGLFTIKGSGKLIFTGDFSGNLCLESGMVEMRENYSRIYAARLIINGGSLTSNGTKAISDIRINGGNVTLDYLDVYNYNQTGGTVNAKEFHNCNGAHLSSCSFSVTGGSLTVDGVGNNFLVFYNDLREGQDITADLTAFMEGFGSVTDSTGSSIKFAVNNIENENSIYEVRFTNESGEPVNYFKVEPKKAPAPQPDPTEPVDTTPSTEATEAVTEPVESTEATEVTEDTTPTEESTEPETNAPTEQSQAPTREPVDDAQPGNPAITIALIAVCAGAIGAGAFLVIKKRR